MTWTHRLRRARPRCGHRLTTYTRLRHATDGRDPTRRVHAHGARLIRLRAIALGSGAPHATLRHTRAPSSSDHGANSGKRGGGESRVMAEGRRAERLRARKAGDGDGGKWCGDAVATALARSAGSCTLDAPRGEPGTHTARAVRTGLGLRPYHAPDEQRLAAEEPG